MKKKTKLDAFERAIEEGADKLVPISGKEGKNIYSLIEKAKKTLA